MTEIPSIEHEIKEQLTSPTEDLVATAVVCVVHQAVGIVDEDNSLEGWKMLEALSEYSSVAAGLLQGPLVFNVELVGLALANAWLPVIRRGSRTAETLLGEQRSDDRHLLDETRQPGRARNVAKNSQTVCGEMYAFPGEVLSREFTEGLFLDSTTCCAKSELVIAEPVRDVADQLFGQS